MHLYSTYPKYLMAIHSMFSEATHMYPVARGDQFECTGSDLKEAVPAGIQTQSLKKKLDFIFRSEVMDSISSLMRKSHLALAISIGFCTNLLILFIFGVCVSICSKCMRALQERFYLNI